MDKRLFNFACVHSLTLALALAWFFTGEVHGQSRPTRLGINITSANSLTALSAEQQAQVKAMVEYWAAMLKKPDARPEEVETARTELIHPLTNPGVTGGFRFDYSRLVVPELEKVVTGNNLHASCNSMIIAGHLASDRSANFLLAHADGLNQPVWQVRLQAAAACKLILESDALDARKTQQAADRLRDAIKHEENALILRHLLAALDAADRTSLRPDERQALRATMAESIVVVIDRLHKNNSASSEHIEAVTSGVLLVRQKYMTVMDTNERRQVGQRLGPGLGKLLSLISSHWEASQADARTKRSYRAVIGTCEGFLATIDTNVRGGTPPQTSLRSAWDSGDKTRFEADLNNWLNLLQQPAYARR